MKSKGQIALFFLVAMSFFVAPKGMAQAPGPYGYAPMQQAEVPRKRRLFTFIPRVGLQLGAWGGSEQVEIDGSGDGDGPYALGYDSDASGGAGAVLGGEALFRFRSGFRIGAGVLVLPGLSYHTTGTGAVDEDFTTGTVIRLPGIFEWEFEVSEPVSLVAGVIPTIMVSSRGEQAKNWARAVCDDPDCKPEGDGVGVAIEGEFGVLYWLGTHALRADLRFGFEVLETASARLNDTTISRNLVTQRMMLLLGYEI